MCSSKRLRVAVIGATGSVGGAALDICGRFPELFEVTGLAANSNEVKLLELGRRYKAAKLSLCEPSHGRFKHDGFECCFGPEGLLDLVSDEEVDHVVFASSGVSAIKALQRALAAGKDVSLANKESIVVAGPWVMPLVKRSDQLRPVDSEHSAIWQLLREDPSKEIRNIWLTASGGPFRDYTQEQMKSIRPADALKHPVWKMGPKITIDSATLMNKGIECIEAMQLFSLSAAQVHALIHPKSQAHGMVLFCDGTMKMLISGADMRLPAAAALAWPNRLPLIDSGLDFIPPEKFDLNFAAINHSLFPCFGIACRAGESGGAYPALLVGADEAAVESFLAGEIPFNAISGVIEETLSRWSGLPPKTLDDAISLVDEGRNLAIDICKSWRHIN